MNTATFQRENGPHFFNLVLFLYKVDLEDLGVCGGSQ